MMGFPFLNLPAKLSMLSWLRDMLGAKANYQMQKAGIRSYCSWHVPLPASDLER